MAMYIYVLFFGMILGFLVSFTGIFLYVLLKKKRLSQKKHGFLSTEVPELSADRQILSSSRTDKSAEEFN